MAVHPNSPYGAEFAPCLKGESLVAYIRTESERTGFSLKTNYALSIANKLISNNEKNVFKRIPQELCQGLVEVHGRNVEASLVARANEGAVRCSGEGLEGTGRPDEEEIAPEGPFSDWDRQECALEQWARSRGVWHDDPYGYADSVCGKKIAQGSESEVFRRNGNSVLKILSCPFNPQETLDRIAINNFLFPDCRLDLEGLGRGRDGELCFILRQPFVHGKSVAEGETEYKGFEAFECLDAEVPNPEYITPYYILGDLHDKNVLRDRAGVLHVIDCNLFLNLKDMGKKGEWEIPRVECSQENLDAVDALIGSLIPKVARAQRLCEVIDMVVPGFHEKIRRDGRHPAVVLPLTNGAAEEYCFEVNPDNPDQILYAKPADIRRMIAGDANLSETQKEALSRGYNVKTASGTLRYSLHRGAALPVAEQQKKKTKTHTQTVTL